jgi:DNA sulfur modification protein DndC
MVDYLVLLSEIRDQYLADNTPWVVCYSGGKDSTAVLQMVFNALSELPPAKLRKELHVLSNDTLVENPAIAEYVNGQLERIEIAGKTRLFAHRPELFRVARVTPTLEDSFWVNLIGKGYPSPNRWFRWCTERLKINPTSRYIKESLSKQGSVIIVLGTRKAESANRAAAMSKHEGDGRLRKHDLPNAYVYAPIADLSNSEVWGYVLQALNPWGGNNKELLALYRKACKGGECPFVIETGTQSCGKSRFGCWVCTVVDKDWAMESYVNNGKKWMKGLLDFRDNLYRIRQQSEQDVPRTLAPDTRFGAFLLATRRELLDSLLNLQANAGVTLITAPELAVTKELLKLESRGAVDHEMCRYTYRLPSGQSIRLVSDYDIQQTPRQRLGPFHLAHAELVEKRSVPTIQRATRIMYKVMDGASSARPSHGAAQGTSQHVGKRPRKEFDHAGERAHRATA